MFKKREPEENKPRLIGEDFSVFPDLGEGNKPRPVELQPEPEVDDEPLEPTPFQKWIAAFPEENWKRVQIAAGVVLGILSALSMTFLSTIEVFANWGLAIGVIMALFVPSQLEKRGGRKMKTLRVSLLIALIVMFGVYILYGFAINPDFFAAKAG